MHPRFSRHCTVPLFCRPLSQKRLQMRHEDRKGPIINVACVAGAWKLWAKERTGARESNVYYYLCCTNIYVERLGPRSGEGPVSESTARPATLLGAWCLNKDLKGPVVDFTRIIKSNIHSTRYLSCHRKQRPLF